MNITIEINTDNAAFEDDCGGELARILREAASGLEHWPGANSFSIGLRDINGNKVGTLIAIDSEEEKDSSFIGNGGL